MIPYGHSLATLCTYRQALQQGRTFARRAFLSFRAQSLSVVTQTLDILLELIPGYIALMRVSNQRSPLLGREFDEGLMAVGMEVLAAVMNNAFFGDGQAKDDLGEMPSVGRRDTVPCRHSGESEKCGQPAL